jgi:hypothetical protein
MVCPKQHGSRDPCQRRGSVTVAGWCPDVLRLGAFSVMTLSSTIRARRMVSKESEAGTPSPLSRLNLTLLRSAPSEGWRASICAPVIAERRCAGRPTKDSRMPKPGTPPPLPFSRTVDSLRRRRSRTKRIRICGVSHILYGAVCSAT